MYDVKSIAIAIAIVVFVFRGWTALSPSFMKSVLKWFSTLSDKKVLWLGIFALVVGIELLLIALRYALLETIAIAFTGTVLIAGSLYMFTQTPFKALIASVGKLSESTKRTVNVIIALVAFAALYLMFY